MICESERYINCFVVVMKENRFVGIFVMMLFKVINCVFLNCRIYDLIFLERDYDMGKV